MSLTVHSAVAGPLARQLLGSAALIAALALVLLMNGGINADIFTALLVFVVVTGGASLTLGVTSVVLRLIAAVHEWRRRS